MPRDVFGDGADTVGPEATSEHIAKTTNVHGIANTASLVTASQPYVVYRFNSFMGSMAALTHLLSPAGGQSIHPSTNLSSLAAWYWDPAHWSLPGHTTQLKLSGIGGHNNVAPTGTPTVSLGLVTVHHAVSAGTVTVALGIGHATSSTQALAASASYSWDTGWVTAPSTPGLLAPTATLANGSLSASSFLQIQGNVVVRRNPA